jgi:hypothetical protein
MTRYLISFDDGAMNFPEEDLPDVAKAATTVVKEARARGTGDPARRDRLIEFASCGGAHG